MPIPDWQSAMLAVLEYLDDGKARTTEDIRGALAERFHVTESELKVPTPSGRQPRFTNNVAWALAYLKRAMAVERVDRSTYRIMDRGRSILASPPERIDIPFLKQFPEFNRSSGEDEDADGPDLPPDGAPLDTEKLRTVCERLLAQGPMGKWEDEIDDLLRKVQSAPERDRPTKEFQRLIWNENPICSPGQGDIDVEKAIETPEFRMWLARRSLDPLPEERGARIETLIALRDEILERLEPFVARAPHLKVYRVLAAFFPRDFTVIGDRDKLRRLHRLLFGESRRGDPVALHADIVRRIDEVLGAPGEAPKELARRMTLPWRLYDDLLGTGGDGTPPIKELSPLPPEDRRKGLTAMRGDFKGMLDVLERVRNEATQVDLLEYMRSRNAKAKEETLKTAINALQGEFDVIAKEGKRYSLTRRGQAVLESGEPDALCDWLLTRILGPDYVLVRLRDEGPLTTEEVMQGLGRQNPGWTTAFAPGQLLRWLSAMSVIKAGPDGRLALTERGRRWAGRIHWEPQPLLRPPPPPPPPPPPGVLLPELRLVIGRIAKYGAFPAERVAHLHTGLWSSRNRQRHLAVLSGLSGSGKTLLATAYARALGPGEENGHLLKVPVQPGWFDTGPLFGYVNPLRANSYVRTQFLEFLLEAVEDPERPYCVILDEMNLSHPEQYLAPILSAMETEGSELAFHCEGVEEFDGVPSSIPYPRNVAIIGTVNMDETTHALSDKVLDRAFTMEFWDVDLDAYPRWVRERLSPGNVKHVADVLKGLKDALSPARLHFGWRTVDDVLDFLEHLEAAGEGKSFDRDLDAVIYAKVLPKLRGTDTERVRNALQGCRAILKERGLEQSSRKVAELLHDLQETGSARFWR